MRKNYMQIVFCIKKLAGIAGGAERVLADIANGLTRRGHSVHVISLDDESHQPFYSFSSDVRFVPIGRSGTGTFSTACQFLRMRKFASDLKPDVIFGFLPSSYIFLSILFWLTPQTFIACEHITEVGMSSASKYSAVVLGSVIVENELPFSRHNGISRNT